MGSGKFYFWFDASPPPADPLPTASAYKSELRELFKDWHPAVQKLIEATDENTMARIEIHDTDPLPALTDPSGKVVLIGDAAHATAPDLGQGGCQALEDAFVLGQLSKKEGLVGADTPVTEAKLQAVGRGYVLSRHERVTSMVLRARKRAEVTHALNGMEETEGAYEVASSTGWGAQLISQLLNAAWYKGTRHFSRPRLKKFEIRHLNNHALCPQQSSKAKMALISFPA